MDITWVTGRIAVGGGIWNAANMAEVLNAEVTHIIDMQIEFDDTKLARPLGIEVLWLPVDDDFQMKPPEVFQRGVEFARRSLDIPNTKLLIHCAAGVHRAPMMALALLCSLGWQLEQAIRLIEARRPVVDFPDIYVGSVRKFLRESLARQK
jgi:protein-tyrosine phosphatase